MPIAGKSGRVLVTGANGFVGTALWEALAGNGIATRLAVRNAQACDAVQRRIGTMEGDLGAETAKIEVVRVGDLSANTDWQAALAGVDVIVHLAGRAHVFREHAADPLAAYRSVNVEGTKRLAEAAVAQKVRRLIYVSSVKVNGERTLERAFDEHDLSQPEDAYGISKWEAELALWDLASRKPMEMVVLRPTLIYGPGVKGNFYALMRAIARGIPLPIASVKNRRSLLYVGNFVDAILRSIGHPAAAGKTYLVADDEGMSSPDLARHVGSALGHPARLLAFPPRLLSLGAAALGKTAAMARLLGSLQVDNCKIRRELSWEPSTNIEQGLAATAKWYRQQSSLHGSE
jgi:nucleoside-diphosphate-sugar epimerase